MRDKQKGSEEPDAPAGELARRCGLCRAVIATEFFSLRGLSVCPACAEGIRQRQSGRGNTRRSLLYGGMAAASMALLWFLATAATSQQLSFVAALAGIVIGLAVYQGSGGRGGLRYQLAAMLLVYAAFVVRFVPPVFGGIADAIKKEHGGQVSEERPGLTTTATAMTSATTTATEPAGSPAQSSVLATLKAYLVFAAIAWGLVLASPFMPSTTSVLGLLSLAAGLAIAFLLNRRARLHGPFQG